MMLLSHFTHGHEMGRAMDAQMRNSKRVCIVAIHHTLRQPR
jgi:hypothetical protein